MNPIPQSMYFRFLGLAHLVAGQYEKAVPMFKKALDRAPEDILAPVTPG